MLSKCVNEYVGEKILKIDDSVINCKFNLTFNNIKLLIDFDQYLFSWIYYNKINLTCIKNLNKKKHQNHNNMQNFLINIVFNIFFNLFKGFLFK